MALEELKGSSPGASLKWFLKSPCSPMKISIFGVCTTFLDISILKYHGPTEGHRPKSQVRSPHVRSQRLSCRETKLCRGRNPINPFRLKKYRPYLILDLFLCGIFNKTGMGTTTLRSSNIEVVKLCEWMCINVPDGRWY